VAGKLFATGSVNLKDKLGWNIETSLVRFKPQYFVSSVKGEISGHVKSQGVWSDDSNELIYVNSMPQVLLTINPFEDEVI
jgi:autotransporter translocation and assembly factor TamB